MTYITILVGFYPVAPSQTNVQISNALDVVQQYLGVFRHRLDIVNAISVDIPEEYADEFMQVMSTVPGVKLVYPSAEMEVFSYGEYGYAQVHVLAPELIPWGIEYVNAPAVHAAGNRGAGVKVCIVDTGIDYNHPDLKANYKGGYNFIANTANPMDDHGHGTHVAGTVAANGRIIGVAPNASIYSCKVLNESGSGSSSGIIAGIDWAVKNGMNIISMSLGFADPNYHDQLLNEACDKAYAAGILIVCAAGNNGAEGDPCGTSTISEPAKYESAIAVTALQCDGALAFFSSRGPKAEITAPGRYVYSTFPIPWGPANIKYRTWSGTSMACPHVSGCAALVWTANPNLTNVQVRQFMANGCTDIGGAGRDGCFGFGLIDAYASCYGTGPRGLPPTPTQTHSACGTGGCTTGLCGATLANECNPDTNCYSCNLGSFWKECAMNPNTGTVKSLAGCLKTCKGYAWGECRESTGGKKNCWPLHKGDPGAIPWDQCERDCEGVTKKYKCSGSPDWVCSENANGQYNTLQDCQNACKSTGCPAFGCSISVG